MSAKGYITKKKKGSGLFEDIHLEGLEILQRLSGSLWTDYNEHDPGVTLLENISYALTELIHKTEVPIKDLLIQKEGEELRSGDNGLFVASDILATDPITFNDYRKIWIDQITNVKNVWIHPVDSYDSEVDNIKGLIHVYVEKYRYESNIEEENKEDLRIIKEIMAGYHNHRNLCEDIYKVEVYQPLFLTMQLRISLEKDMNGEEVLASIFHEVNDYLTPEVNYYSLWQLKQKKMTTNDIFNGPRLSNGFILDEDLKDPLEQIVLSDIIKIISRIGGIVSINDFCLWYDDKEKGGRVYIRDRFDIPKNTAPIAEFPVSNEQLIFENSGVLFKPDLVETKKQLSFIQALDYGGFKAASKSLNEIPIPLGTYQDITSYYPIRKQFPELYGIGDLGIRDTITPLREAQVKQLKGYLMPFDQLMINFLSQLSKLYTLYDVNYKGENSYFTQESPDLNELLDLITPVTGGLVDASEIRSYWNTILEDLNTRFDGHAITRYNQAMDQLLSRFNEEFQTYSLRKINSNSYGEDLTSTRFEKEALEMKRKLIRDYDVISYTRARSFNYTKISDVLAQEEEGQIDFIPGLFRKIAILTGMDNFNIKSLTKAITDSETTVHPRAMEIELITKEIDIHIPESTIELVEIEDVTVSEVLEEDLRKVMHYIGGENSILNDVLRDGILSENYTIKKGLDSDDLYYVLYKRGSKESNIAHIAKDQKEADAAIKKAIDHLVDLNHKSEGFFVIEHLLLLPPYQGAYFGFSLDFSTLSNEIDLRIQHNELTSCGSRDQKVKKFLDELYEEQLHYASRKKNGSYVMEVCGVDGEVLVISENQYTSEKQVQEAVDSLKNVISEIEKDTLAKAIQCFVYYGKNVVEENFFSFQISFLMPSWPVRFQDPSFKMMFENMVYEQAPIHLKSTVYWLNYEVIDLYEAYYFKWQKMLIDQSTIEDQMYQAYQLITMLQELYHQYQTS